MRSRRTPARACVMPLRSTNSSMRIMISERNARLRAPAPGIRHPEMRCRCHTPSSLEASAKSASIVAAEASSRDHSLWARRLPPSEPRCVHLHSSIHIAGSVRSPMRTNIVIDPKLMREALRLSSAPTKRQVVEDSLRLLIQVKKQERIRKVRGRLKWSGDLSSMRRSINRKWCSRRSCISRLPPSVRACSPWSES